MHRLDEVMLANNRITHNLRGGGTCELLQIYHNLTYTTPLVAFCGTVYRMSIIPS